MLKRILAFVLIGDGLVTLFWGAGFLRWQRRWRLAGAVPRSSGCWGGLICCSAWGPHWRPSRATRF